MSLSKLSNRAIDWIKSNQHLSEKQHQISGIEWCLNRELAFEYGGDGGGILADEMGLGKTILMIAAIVANPKPHTLIVVPPALVNQWKDAIELFAPEVNSINGTMLEIPIYRSSKYTEIVHKKDTISSIYDFKDLSGNRIWITTYGMISTRKNKKWSSPLWRSSIGKACKRENMPVWGWDRVIYDEAHHMRNRRSKKYAGSFEIGGKIKWLVTGTPVQNRLADLDSLFSLLGNELNSSAAATVKKYVLGRTKKSVGIKMPSKTLHTVYVELCPSENLDEYNLVTQIHNHIHFQNVTLENVDRIISEVFEGKQFKLYTAARQSCILPEMVTKRAVRVVEASEGLDIDELTQVNTHSKLTAIANHISKNQRSGSKLVFTHYRSEMDRLKLLLRQKNVTVSKLDGRTKKKDRSGILSCANDLFTQLVLNRKIRIRGIQKMILSYLMPDVLLIQIKSGCEGLNLQAYNNVYFTSPHWNPAVEDQAMGRSHRIGQTKPVNVYHFMTKLVGEDSQSLDEYCMSVQKIKRELMEIISSNSQK
ncbi:MAG: hypothetical protein CXT73_03410 [Methanobacteriota archaeon]|nr:MAG: hypothetical protein CXT73_03410 [Euryarchaeota archaeon]